MSEAIAQQQCLEWLAMCKVFAWRNNTGALKVDNRYVRFGFKGSSDIIGVLPDGRFVGVECKDEGEPLRKDQVTFANNINKKNGVAFSATYPNHIDDLERNLSDKLPLSAADLLDIRGRFNIAKNTQP